VVRPRDGEAGAVGLAHYADPHDDTSRDIGADAGLVLHDPLRVDAGKADHVHATPDNDRTEADHPLDRAGPGPGPDAATQADHPHDDGATHHHHDGTPRGWFRLLRWWVARDKSDRSVDQLLLSEIGKLNDWVVVGPTRLEPELDLLAARGSILAPGLGAPETTFADAVRAFATCPGRAMPVQRGHYWPTAAT
jgi:hypothetical protein